MHCSENRFCASLDPDVRARLCSFCVKTTHAANTHVSMDYYKHFLVLEGLCGPRHGRTCHLYRPGDFVLTPHPDQSRMINLPNVTFEGGDLVTVMEFFSDVTLAYFDKEKVDELLSDSRFLRASYDNLKDLYVHLVAFPIGLNKSSAYDAVCYVLKYCAHNDIGHLTHEQIAKITGHSRTTVTSIMHEIALAEPDLLR